MDTSNTPAVASGIDDLFTLTLVDGLPAQSAGKEIRFRVVKLRETNVADERVASRLAERVVTVGGLPKLLVSEADFTLALTMRHCEKFLCDSSELPQAAVDLDVFGKLSSHDLQLIEQRVMLITLAAEVRYGNITQADFDTIVSGGQLKGAVAAPQRVGQAADVGQGSPAARPGPALLADFAGAGAAGAAPGHAQ